MFVKSAHINFFNQFNIPTTRIHVNPDKGWNASGKDYRWQVNQLIFSQFFLRFFCRLFLMMRLMKRSFCSLFWMLVALLICRHSRSHTNHCLLGGRCSGKRAYGVCRNSACIFLTVCQKISVMLLRSFRILCIHTHKLALYMNLPF